MKRLLPLLLILFAYSSGFSQSKGSPEEKAKYLTETILKSDLKLANAQIPKVYEVNLDMFRKISKEEASGGSIRQIRTFMLERNEELQKVLTAPQYEKFETNFRDYQEKMEEKFGS